MKTQPSNWLQMSDALKTLAAGFEKVDAVERNGGFKLPQIGTLPSLNGKTNGHSNGHAVVAKALPAPQKVKKAAIKALPAPAEAKPAKVAKKAKAEKVAKAKPAKAEKVAKGKAKAAPASANAIAIGRRAVANGERPKLVEAIAIVKGDEVLTAGVILARLVEIGWTPGASNPQSYISYTLSDNGKVFKRGNRGEYSVIRPKDFVDLTAQWGAGKIAKAKAAAPKEVKEAAVAKAEPKAKAAPKAKKAKGSKTSKKAEGVASTDTDVTEALTTAAEPAEVVQEPVVTAEAAPVAGDPPTTTTDAEISTSSTDEALQGLGLDSKEVSENPFDALS